MQRTFPCQSIRAQDVEVLYNVHSCMHTRKYVRRMIAYTNVQVAHRPVTVYTFVPWMHCMVTESLIECEDA
jgi:hypothetical protein